MYYNIQKLSEIQIKIRDAKFKLTVIRQIEKLEKEVVLINRDIKKYNTKLNKKLSIIEDLANQL